MLRAPYLLLLFSCAISCGTSNNNTCSGRNIESKSSIKLNSTRLKYGIPITHDYMCLESVTEKMENWEATPEFQKTAKKGFHAGKGIFLQSTAEFDEKDIYRHRINDSTYETLGIITELRDGVVSFPNIWFSTVDAKYIQEKRAGVVLSSPSNTTHHLSINQADSMLASWETNRR